jgi:hypothetical protein
VRDDRLQPRALQSQREIRGQQRRTGWVEHAGDLHPRAQTTGELDDTRRTTIARITRGSRSWWEKTHLAEGGQPAAHPDRAVDPGGVDSPDLGRPG